MTIIRVRVRGRVRVRVRIRVRVWGRVKNRKIMGTGVLKSPFSGVIYSLVPILPHFAGVCVCVCVCVCVIATGDTV